MAILRSFSIFLRNALIKQHPYFSCCASCGEIKTPVGERLCTSLNVSFPIDAVIIPQEEQYAEITPCINSLLHNAPWIRHIHVIGNNLPPSPATQTNVSYISLELNPHLKETYPEAHLHLLDITDYYLVMSTKFSLTVPVLPQDFFTPNGIPLIYSEVENADSPTHIYSKHLLVHTRENSIDFLTDHKNIFQQENFSYITNVNRWAFDTCRAIPGGYSKRFSHD